MDVLRIPGSWTLRAAFARLLGIVAILVLTAAAQLPSDLTWFAKDGSGMGKASSADQKATQIKPVAPQRPGDERLLDPPPALVTAVPKLQFAAVVDLRAAAGLRTLPVPAHSRRQSPRAPPQV